MTNKDAIWVLELIRDRYSALDIERLSLTDAETDAINTAIEALERKSGKWIDEGFYADGHGAHAFRCSECGEHIIEYDIDPFCRWCGADMRGERG